jgi:hypothetical protein
VNFLSRTGLVGHVVSFGIAGLILVGACIALFRSFRIIRKESSSAKAVTGLIATILAAAAVITATSFPASANPSKAKVQHAASRTESVPLQFRVPHPAYPDNPLPRVSCVQRLSITGHIPTGDVLVTANEVVGSSGYYFISVDQADNPNSTKWSVTVDFGNDQNASKKFHLVAFALPAIWSKYLNGLYAGLGGKGGGWDYGTLPPEHAELVREDVRRKNDTCPKS